MVLSVNGHATPFFVIEVIRPAPLPVRAGSIAWRPFEPTPVVTVNVSVLPPTGAPAWLVAQTSEPNEDPLRPSSHFSSCSAEMTETPRAMAAATMASDDAC